ncbi:RNA polymerase sigma factor [Planctomycetes bacterium Poly30]|uniref:RNA polymerase sigma factor n=1 Tax=Saltatorellus ferox TaxID=2528018 RepID=A0A518F0C4_9BACT|nr:RNA polymerase sigma factor [Planctomycetes bacterium Poly30]
MNTLDIEAILSQDEWLRRMARSLVQDPHAADDLVQEAWLADLQAGRAARDKRSWLSVVLLRAGSKAFRSARNQRERAESAAHLREQEAPATDEVVGDRQLRSLVAEELLALPEPQRTALHLVYVADLSVTEAAGRMGVAKSTASQRVDRGLEMLRQRIDAAHGGDRRSWCLALLPWAAPRKETAAAAASSATVVTGSIGRPAVFGAAALVAASALAVAWVWGSSAPGSAGPATLAGAPMSTASLAPVANLAAPGPDPARSAAAAPTTRPAMDRTARISARFVDDEGQPVPGVSWSLSGRTKGGADESNQQVQEAPEDSLEWEDLAGELGPDGNMEVSFDVPLNYRFYLEVKAQGRATAAWRFDAIEAGNDKRLGTLELEPGHALRGRMESPTGETLSDRSWGVVAESRRADTMFERTSTRLRAVVPEGQSTFEVSGLPAGEVEFSFYSSQGERTREPEVVTLPVVGTEPWAFPVDLSATVSSSLRLSLSRRVGPLDPAIAPESFQATAADGTVLEVVALDDAGWTFEVRDAAPAPISVTLTDPRFEPWSAEIQETGEIKSVVLLGSASLELDVRDAGGNPVSLYSVALAETLAPGHFSSYVNPVHDGKEELPGGVIEHVVPRSYRLFVRGAAGESTVALENLQPGERRVVSLTLEPLSAMTGTVSYPDGEPAIGVKVYLVRPAQIDDSPASMMMLGGGAGYGGEEWRMSAAETLADEEGRFEIDLPDAGSYYVMADRPGRTWVLSDLRTAQDHGEPVHLILPRGATLEGTIELPAHLPTGGWAVYLGIADPRMAGSPGWRAPELDANGKFHVEGIPAGETLVAITRERVRSWSSFSGPPAASFVIGSVVLEEGEVHQESFGFVNGAPVAVSAELPPASGAASSAQTSVSFYRVDGESPRRQGGIKGPADALGSCLLEPGEYVASVVQGDAAVLNGPVVTVPETAAHVVPVGLTVTEHRLRVFVAEEPLAGQSVEFRSPAGPRASFETDGEGWLTIRLDAGPLKARWRMQQAELSWPPTSDMLSLRQ